MPNNARGEFGLDFDCLGLVERSKAVIEKTLVFLLNVSDIPP